MSRSSVWTPRRTTQLWPPFGGSDITEDSNNALKELAAHRSARQTAKENFAHRSRAKFSFKPALLGPSTYVAPPPPTFPKKDKTPSNPKEDTIPSGELNAIAAKLQGEADVLEQSSPPPSLKQQLGGMLLEGKLSVPKLLKEWDAKNKGEVLKGTMRNNLRNSGFTVTPQEADELFNSWDEDGGGSLTIDELKDALIKCQEAIRVQRSTANPQEIRAAALRRRAHDALKAAELTERASALREELQRMLSEYESRADLRLGALLHKRRIKPGAVVVQWASAGSEPGELSKADFRRAVLHLFSSRSSTPPPTNRSAFRWAVQDSGNAVMSSGPQTSTAEIDAVFDMYDGDGGGSLDEDEAKAMIRGLQETAEKVEHEKMAKEREERSVRAHAARLAAAVMASIEGHDPEEAFTA